MEKDAESQPNYLDLQEEGNLRGGSAKHCRSPPSVRGPETEVLPPAEYPNRTPGHLPQRKWIKQCRTYEERCTVLRPRGLTYARYGSENAPEYKVNEKLPNFATYFSSLFSNIGYLEMMRAAMANLGEQWELSNVTTWRLGGASWLFTPTLWGTPVSGFFFWEGHPSSLPHREPCSLLRSSPHPEWHPTTWTQPTKGLDVKEMGPSSAVSPKTKGSRSFVLWIIS